MLVDSQCHASGLWYEPIEALLPHMTHSGVDQAVLIQMLGQTDNRYQQDCLKRFPGRYASVVLVDPSAPNALHELSALAEDGASGVRLRPSARSAGTDALAIWRWAAELGLAVSCVGNAAAFTSPEFSEVIAALPSLTIVLEHLGGTSTPDADEAARAQRLRVMELARFPNVYMKVPGLGELVPRISPPPADGSPFASGVPAVLQAAINAFGAGRLMWGSDFPVVSSREGYGNALALCRDALDHLSRAETEEIFGNVARRVFRLPS